MAPSSQADRSFALGQQSHQAGQLASAEQHYRDTLKIAPAHVNALYALGIIGLQTGRNDLAAEMIGKAVALNGRDADWHYNLGLAFERLGRPAEAVAHHQRALALKPNHVNAINHLGIAAFDRPAEAMAHFQRALAIDPRHVPTLMSLGNLHAACGEFDKAAAVYEGIVSSRPNPVAVENLAQANLMRGEHGRALAALQQGFRLGSTPRMRELFVLCARDLRATSDDPGLRDLTLRALSEGWGPAPMLGKLAASLVKARPQAAAIVARAAAAGRRRLPAAELFGTAGLTDIAADPLLATLLETIHVPDAEFERFLTAVRAALLEFAAAPDNAELDPNALRLLAALARHCFLNEYVFDASPQDEERVQGLRRRLAAALQSGARPSATFVAAVGCYVPLHGVPQAQALLGFAWPEPIGKLVVQQVREPLEEQTARGSIPPLTPIEDRVSQAVRAQYEEHPYPRWVRIPPAAPRASLEDHVRAEVPSGPLVAPGKGNDIDILIAGCGTGPMVGSLAQLFPASRILAIDLSLASLAYAQRKTQEAGHRNVEFGQADILKLATVGRSFDLIDSRGVLHHMDDPLAGWSALASMLRPNGLMTIGLYSELAREHMAAARALVVERGYSSTLEGIRRFRQDIMDSPDRAAFEGILISDDFYTTSTCRDLLFHVREHRFTLPQIAAFLQPCGLRMLGFELPPTVLQRYARRFPADLTRTDLAAWHEFERDHPDTFRGMYQFWVQRVA